MIRLLHFQYVVLEFNPTAGKLEDCCQDFASSLAGKTTQGLIGLLLPSAFDSVI
jgi:hypothetical protein